ncbi:MAG: hypothetical protein AAFU65_17725, partial [Pseudomonadota bacterium]
MNRTLASCWIAALASALWLNEADAEPHFLFSGCEDIVAESTCERAVDEPLVLWISAEVSPPHEFRLDQRVIEPDAVVDTGDGSRYVFHLGAQIGKFSTTGQKREAFWLNLQPQPTLPAWRRAQQAFDQRDYDEAGLWIQEILANCTCSERALALRMAGR